MTYQLSSRSLSRLEGVHPRLVSVVKLAIKMTEQDFAVTEGLRTRDRQRELFAAGKSKTMNSRHLTGHAVDLMPVGVPDVWNTKNPDVLAAWLTVSDAMHSAAKRVGVPLRWGGDWNGDGYEVGRDNWDMPHFELPTVNYP